MKKLLTLLTFILLVVTLPSQAMAEEQYYYEIPVKIYHYALDVRCTGVWTKLNKTASGTTPQVNRTIAHGSLEFGTKVKIGDQEYVVEDRGSGISGNKIDVFVGSYEEAVQLGVKEDVMRVYLPEGVTTITHVIKSGDTLSLIAKKYGTGVSDITKANNIENPNKLLIGDELIIPIVIKEEDVNWEKYYQLSPLLS